MFDNAELLALPRIHHVEVVLLESRGPEKGRLFMIAGALGLTVTADGVDVDEAPTKSTRPL